MTTKTYYAAIIFLFLFCACQQKVKIEEDNSTETTTEILIENIKTDDVEILEIEGCEYIVFKSTPSDNSRIGYGFMSHKGNCKNPIHYHNRNISGRDSIN